MVWCNLGTSAVYGLVCGIVNTLIYLEFAVFNYSGFNMLDVSFRWEAAEKLCKTLLQSCPAAYQLCEALADLYLERKQIDDAVNAWLCAFRRSPHNAQLFYYAFKFFISVVCICNFLIYIFEKFWSIHSKIGFHKMQ